jgi:hypothetical protein
MVWQNTFKDSLGRNLSNYKDPANRAGLSRSSRTAAGSWAEPTVLGRCTTHEIVVARACLPRPWDNVREVRKQFRIQIRKNMIEKQRRLRLLEHKSGNLHECFARFPELGRLGSLDTARARRWWWLPPPTNLMAPPPYTGPLSELCCLVRGTVLQKVVAAGRQRMHAHSGQVLYNIC